MNLTVIMFFSPSVFLCYVPAPYLLNDWKQIKEMSKARILRLYSETKLTLILDSNSSKYRSSVVGVGLARV